MTKREIESLVIKPTCCGGVRLTVCYVDGTHIGIAESVDGEHHQRIILSVRSTPGNIKHVAEIRDELAAQIDEELRARKRAFYHGRDK